MEDKMKVLGIVVLTVVLAVSGFAQTVYSEDPKDAVQDPSKGSGNMSEIWINGHIGWSGVILDTTIEGTVWTQPIRIRREASDRGAMGPVRAAYGVLTIVLDDIHGTAEDTTKVDSVGYLLRGAADPNLPFARLAGDWAGQDVIIDPATAISDSGAYVVPYELPGGQEVQWYFYCPDSTEVKVYDLRWDW